MSLVPAPAGGRSSTRSSTCPASAPGPWRPRTRAPPPGRRRWPGPCRSPGRPRRPPRPVRPRRPRRPGRRWVAARAGGGGPRSLLDAATARGPRRPGRRRRDWGRGGRGGRGGIDDPLGQHPAGRGQDADDGQARRDRQHEVARSPSRSLRAGAAPSSRAGLVRRRRTLVPRSHALQYGGPAATSSRHRPGSAATASAGPRPRRRRSRYRLRPMPT
jgi:hypothetical protein